ncbi:hypothetical protein R16034_02988 [Ralstonia edaphis]|uniref:Transmembrane protein n=1 Tax=Ralstonia edaphi TaxID=3058599 RepID=A0AB72X2D5_9RALS|nr:hypothetical protein [Ralstonia sp. LMG 6871]CAJ0742137.1 hypothetical protein R16034_02988 [Ralstonia sp. LMG 6871]
MNVLQLVAMFATLAVQAAAVGFLFAWRSKNDPTVNGYTAPPKPFNGLARVLLWLAVVCIGGAFVTTGLMAYGVFAEAE